MQNCSLYLETKGETMTDRKALTAPCGLTGWNAIRDRVKQLGLDLDDHEIKQLTWKIKKISDTTPMKMPQVDHLLKEAAQQKNIVF